MREGRGEEEEEEACSGRWREREGGREKDFLTEGGPLKRAELASDGVDNLLAPRRQGEEGREGGRA